MAIDLNRLSAKELEALIAQAKKRRDTLNKRKPIATVRSKLAQLARAEGYTIAELFGGAAPAAAKTATKKPRTTTKGRKLGAVAPKYRNPANPKDTWTGRGKQPRWLAAETSKGRKLEEFLIQ
jgi:DNA-binding protein H-NS